MMGWFHDLRGAVRQLGSRPGFTLVVLVIVAVGIGANTATFSLVNGLLLQPLPYPDSEAIVSVGQVPGQRRGRPILSNTELQRLWDDAQSFEQLAAYAPFAVTWRGPDGPSTLFGTAVTPSLFPLLRATPQLGRVFTEADIVEGSHRIVLLSNRAWTNRFGSDPDIIGAPVELNDEPHTVVGVLPNGFDFPYPEVELWTPLVVRANEEPVAGGVVIQGAFMGIGRLRTGISLERAATEVRTILDRAEPDRLFPRLLEFETRVISLREELGRPFRPALVMLTAATGLVLLMACANVAGLLLARGIVRQRELAVRRALGAGRGRIVRQLLTESVVLSLAGGAGGLVVAAGFVRAAQVLVPGIVPGLTEVGLDGAVIAFAAGLSVVVGLLFGTVPARAWSRVDFARTLNGVGVLSAGGFGRLRANRGQAVLAVAQVTLALVLLTNAGLLLRSFVALVTIDLGFDPTNVVIARVQSPANPAFRGGQFGPDELVAMGTATWRSAETILAGLERIANLPGVDAVAVSTSAPLNPAPSIRSIGVVGRPTPTFPGEQLQAGIRMVSPGYADVLQLRLRAGRFFTNRDTAGGPPMVIVSESFALEAFGGEPALGQRLRVQSAFPFPAFGRDDNNAGSNETWEVIGVVGDTTSPYVRQPFGPAVAGDIYLSMLQPPMDRMLFFSELNVALRTAADPPAVLPFLHEVLADIHPGPPINATALDTILSTEAAQPRFYAACAVVFGTVALLLAAFGLYGVLSYTVAQRRAEIGLRVALGARRRDVFMLVISQGSALVSAGIILGLLAGAGATRIIESILFGVRPADPLLLAAVTMVLLTVAVLACWLPARQAIRIDPIEALRES